MFGLSPDGNVLIQEDENDSERFTRFDAVNRPIAVRVFRAGQNDSYVGDALFAPAPVSDPSNPSTSFPAVVGTTKQNFEYNGLSRLTRGTDNNNPLDPTDDSTVTNAYDSLGNVIEETQKIGLLPTQAVSSGYRAGNFGSSVTYPNGRRIHNTPDALDRLSTVSDLVSVPASPAAIVEIARYQYIGARVLVRAMGNGTRMTYLDDTGTTDVGYDALGRTVQIRNLRNDNSVIVGTGYSYDRNSPLAMTPPPEPANSEDYGLDSANRLTAFTRTNPDAITALDNNWTLDGAGNWKSVDGETRQHSSINEIIRRTTGATSTTILSDDNGNQTDDGKFLITWDSQNHLRTVTRKSDNALVEANSYDAAGRRIRKVVTNSGSLNGTTDFYSDGAREIEEHNAANVLTQQYVYGNYIDEPLEMDRDLNGDGTATGPGDQRLYYSQNALFSTIALTDAAGKIVEGYQYAPYGEPTVITAGANGVVDFGGDDVITFGDSSTVSNPFLFTGRRLDGETELYYYRTRYMDPIEGRFKSRDTIGIWRDAGNSGNGYAYVGNNSLTYVDPSGQLPNACQDGCTRTLLISSTACYVSSAFCGPEYVPCLFVCLTFVTAEWVNCSYGCKQGGKGTVTGNGTGGGPLGAGREKVSGTNGTVGACQRARYLLAERSCFCKLRSVGAGIDL